jgi:DNA-directed RNA polymerase subunit RPC12/RpoP
MAELLARDKYHCPACGADAHWDPAKQALVCPFCGTVSPAEITPEGKIREHDLVAALRGIPQDQRGYNTARVSVKCQSCQAISSFDPNRVGQNCEFCGSAQLVPHEQTLAPIRPESLLAFTVTQTAVRDTVRQWYASRWFAPNALKKRALTDTVKGVYLPYWTFDAKVHADWTAESGDYYWETESYRDAQGNRQTRRVRKIRWRWTSGSLNHFFDDHLIPGTKGVHAGLLEKVEPFPTKELKPYDAGYLAGWIVEQYQVDLSAAAKRSRQEMDAAVRSLCASQVPGDTHRNLSVSAQYSALTFKHVLVPVWLLTYDYGRKSYQVLVNGYTGQIAGERPYSFWKITFLVLAVLAAVGLGLLVANR